MKYIPSNDTKFKNKLKETTKFFRKKCYILVCIFYIFLAFILKLSTLLKAN